MSIPSPVPYVKLNPDWYYSYLDIPNLDEITRQLNAMLDKRVEHVSYNDYYINIFAKVAYEECPALHEYLKSVKLDHKFTRVLATKSSHNQPAYHVDTNDPYRCMHSLNIPLIDTDDSYTIWANTKARKLKISEIMGGNTKTLEDIMRNFGFMEDEFCTEIARVKYTQPALVNTTILHKGQSNNPNRRICGLRFVPQLTAQDAMNLGIKNPFIQDAQ